MNLGEFKCEDGIFYLLNEGPRAKFDVIEFNPDEGLHVEGILLGSTKPIEFDGYIFTSREKFVLEVNQMTRQFMGHKIVLQEYEEDDKTNEVAVFIDGQKVDVPVTGTKKIPVLTRKVPFPECLSPGWWEKILEFRTKQD